MDGLPRAALRWPWRDSWTRMDRRSVKSDVEVRVGLGSCGVASGGRAVAEAAGLALAQLGSASNVKPVGCNGLCHREPLLEVVDAHGRAHLYGNVRPQAVPRILRRHASPDGWLRRASLAVKAALGRLTDDSAWDPPSRYEVRVGAGGAAAYLGKQRKIVLENCGEIDPLCIDDYLQRDGYKSWQQALAGMSAEQVIGVVTRSGLRGRGGAGFPTGRKWQITRDAPGDKKYVICNGDEGDPGAFMDRLVLEGDPHRVIEGAALAAYSVGADEVHLYIRAEYPLAVKNVTAAIRHAEERGFLGADILGSGYSLKLHVMEGAGAFVCGEETALIACLEGNRGSPRLRPPYPSTSGLWGKPTLVNNVETLACVPWILRHGPERFAELGTQGSPGTKVFALAGKVKRGGLIEVPMGLTIWEIVHDIGGGIVDDRPFKAVQIGGPAGGCIPASLAHTAVDYEDLVELGAIRGSGGLVVLDDTDCMVDIARFFLEFTQRESCGRCTFCRVGTKRMVEILDRLCSGEAGRSDIETLEQLAHDVQGASLCGLGHNAPNPVLSTLRYFREEYEAHAQGHCPAGKCRALIRYEINDECIGCTRCAQNCPADAIAPRPYEKHEIDSVKCVRCGMCRAVCPMDAIEIKT